MWCIPEVDDEFVRKMMDVLEVYERPYDKKRPVVCFDEKNTQLLSRKRAGFVGKHSIRHKDYEYTRHGSVNLFVSFEAKRNHRHITVSLRRTKKDFAKEIKHLVDVRYPKAEKVVLVMDNLNTHTYQALVDTLGTKEADRINQRLEWHYTPKHASWLNMAELEISALETQLLRKKDLPSFHQMQSEVFALVKRRNKKQTGVNWKFNRNKAGQTFKINDSVSCE